MRNNAKSFVQWLQKLRDRVRRRVALMCFDVSAARSSRQPQQAPSNQIVFIRWDAKLGDTIVTSWLFREIKKYRPQMRSVVVAPKAFESIFVRDYGVDQFIESPKKIKFADVRRIAHQIGHAQYVLHLSQPLKPKDIYLLSLLKSRFVVGLDDPVGLINIKAGALTAGQHFNDKVAVMMEHMGVNQYDQSYMVPQDNQVRDRILAWWPKTPVIAFNPLGRGTARRLSPAVAIDVLNQILRATSAHVLILVEPNEVLYAFELKSGAWAPERVCLVQQDVLNNAMSALFEMVRLSSAMVSIDTATIHIACGLDKPVFGFYNPKQDACDLNYESWSPKGASFVAQFAQLTQPQSIDAIDVKEFAQLFDQFLIQHLPALKARAS